MVTKLNIVAITAIVAALAIPAIASSAFARVNQTPAWDTCFALAVERGSGPNRGGSDKVMSQYNRFMDECLTGKIPLSTGASASAVKLHGR
jgi:hypothetical protein